MEGPIGKSETSAKGHYSVDAACRSAGPTIKVGPVLVDARVLETIEPELVLDIARSLIDPEVRRSTEKRIAALARRCVEVMLSCPR
ncbi:MAG: hypothetical protein M3083_25290 [Actinomycetota bacterium]|nr:hypothetical protein [Actinomycetota bacterium]